MHSLLKVILFAPAIVSAFVLPLFSESVQDGDAKYKLINIGTTDAYTKGFVRLDIGHGSPSADISPLDLRLDILHSTEACGFGNVTIDGQALSQTFDPETLVSSGKGSVSTSTNKIVVGSWYFDCIFIDGKPHGQLMKFMVDFVDGKSIENTGFSVLFRQTEETEIMNIETISSQEDEVIEHHSPQGQSPDRQHHNSQHSEGEHKYYMGKGLDGEHHHHMGHKDFNIHKEMAEFRYMKAQLKELKYLIHEKRRYITKHAQEDNNRDNGIKDCDSLRCIAVIISEKARKFCGKIAGDRFDEESFHRSLEKQSRKGEKFGKGLDEKPGNHISGNNTCPDGPDGKDNHTGPHFPPPHRHHILPVCHYPPPFDFYPHAPHRDGPHGPSHGPPPHEFGPRGFEHGRHPEMSPSHHDEEEGRPWEGRPRHQDGHHGRPHGDELEGGERSHRGHGESPKHDGPPHGHDEFDDEFEGRHGRHGDDFEELDRFHREHDGSSHRYADIDDDSEGRHGKHAIPNHKQGPPSFDGPESDRFEENHHGKPPHGGSFDGLEDEESHHPHGEEFHNGPHHEGPHYEDFENSELEFDGPPHDNPFREGPPEDHPGFDESPPHDGPHSGSAIHFYGPPHDGHPPHMMEGGGDQGPPPHNPPGFPIHILKFATIGFLFSILIIALYHRTCNPKARSLRQARRSDRCRRRAYCRAAHKSTFKTWWTRLTNRDKEEEYEEKGALLEDCDSDSESTISIGENITSFRNAANIVSDMIAAEEGRSPISLQISHAHRTPEYVGSGLNYDGYTNTSEMEMEDEDEDEDVLPAYEDHDHDGNDASTLVADGFRYTPGGSAYSHELFGVW
ncbi:hypothetical protein SBOR_9120 [Sclerotinia borealis F-4128]|uniref:Uncharacterized protein n=1 Tax=Sclerotinia borealis (strain F-4128) TaxID=1432307 RepID=W9C7E6_SCLBF|nr:hypothetical protein SBOR_9120 [Sclerotinia borealis F-4128]